ncbi:putative ribonuclease H-like domain-containing protein [Tanacetum coccineum]
MRAKRYFQRTGKKIFINGNDVASYDKTKVECFNCHKLGHFARECRLPRNKDGQYRYQDNTRKQGNNEDTSSKEMLAIDGVGFDWSDMAEEQVQTNMALMCDDLIVKLNQTEFKASTYKRSLATVEEQLATYRKNEVLFSEEVAVLKREVACKDYEIYKLLGSKITDKSKKGLRYNTVPPPHPLIYNGPSKLDLSYSCLDEFKEPEFKGYGPRNDKTESNINCDEKSDNPNENTDDSLVKEQVSEDKNSFVESPHNSNNKNVFHTAKKAKGNQSIGMVQKSNQLGSDFVCYHSLLGIDGNFNHMHDNCPTPSRKGMGGICAHLSSRNEWKDFVTSNKVSNLFSSQKRSVWKWLVITAFLALDVEQDNSAGASKPVSNAGEFQKRKQLDKREESTAEATQATHVIDWKWILLILEYLFIRIDLTLVLNNWKSYCKEDVGYYEIHRADGSYKAYIYFSDMLSEFDREDLVVLNFLNKYVTDSTRPGFDDLILWGDMKVIVHSLMLTEVTINMLVEKKYPLPQDILVRILRWKLHVNNDVTKMAYEILRFTRSQLYQQ